MNSFERFLVVSMILAFALGIASHFGYVRLVGPWQRTEAKCAESEETKRLDLCTKRGGAYVDGKCFGPLPAPEGK